MSLFYSDESQANLSERAMARTIKPPHPIFDSIFAFAPNREILGGTAYFIVENAGNILIDCPSASAEIENFIADRGGIAWLVLTHRGGIGSNVRALQEKFGCAIAIQEQEAYLLPRVNVQSFHEQLSLSDDCEVFWTPGHSPGSSCLYLRRYGGILLSGRHLLPTPEGAIAPLRRPKTFHWPRQLQSVAKLQTRFSAQTLQFLCPGANSGFLRGEGAIENAYTCISALDIRELRHAKIVL